MVSGRIGAKLVARGPPPRAQVARRLGPRGRVEVVALNAHQEESLVGRIEQAAAIMLYHEVSLTRRTIERLTRQKIDVVALPIAAHRLGKTH